MITTSSKILLRRWFAAAVGLLVIGVTGTGASQATGPHAEQKSSYYPLALGNRWLYTVKEKAKKATTSIEWRVAYKEKELFRGAPAYQLSSTPVQDDTPVILSAGESGIFDTDTGNILLKSPLHTGDRWNAAVSTKPNTFEVVSAGKSCVVGGHRFRDCATVREVDEAAGAAGLVTLVTYARGVGPVAYVYYQGLDAKTIDSTLTIKSWHVE